MSSLKTTIVIVAVISVLAGFAYLSTRPAVALPATQTPEGIIASTSSDAVRDRGQWLSFFSGLISTAGSTASSYLNSSEANRRAQSGGSVPPNSVEYHPATGNV